MVKPCIILFLILIIVCLLKSDKEGLLSDYDTRVKYEMKKSEVGTKQRQNTAYKNISDEYLASMIYAGN